MNVWYQVASCAGFRKYEAKNKNFEILSSWAFSQFAWWGQLSTAFPKKRIITINDVKELGTHIVRASSPNSVLRFQWWGAHHLTSQLIPCLDSSVRGCFLRPSYNLPPVSFPRLLQSVFGSHTMCKSELEHSVAIGRPSYLAPLRSMFLVKILVSKWRRKGVVDTILSNIVLLRYFPTPFHMIGLSENQAHQE